jgi:hypothetical protein
MGGASNTSGRDEKSVKILPKILKRKGLLAVDYNY